MAQIFLKDESYKIVGCCMEVHTGLGMGFKETVYKDALEFEFRRNEILYRREKKFFIEYKGYVLPHSYIADFIVYDSIVLEVKATSMIVNGFVKQTINYLKASDLQLGIIANFGQSSFISKRIVF
jgi:GxxExxY protein